jgi:serine/threonine-protein kinase
VLAAHEVVEDPDDAADPDRRPGEVSDKTRSIVYVATAVALLVYVVVLALGLKTLLSSESGGVVVAPDLIGRTLDQAETQLSATGLRIGDVDTRYSTVPVGRILAQEPKARLVVGDEGTVDLVFSKGPERTTVPALIGQQRAEAEDYLRQAKLQPMAEVILRDGNLPEGLVLEAIPAAGTVKVVNSPVRLVVASGRAEVPNVVGSPVADAAVTLQRAGFNVGIRYVDSTGQPGLVVDQRPNGGNTAERQSDIVLEVSQVPPPPPPTPDPTVAPTTEPTVTPTPTGTTTFPP